MPDTPDPARSAPAGSAPHSVGAGFERINDRGLVLLGCGEMGASLLAGWLANGLARRSTHVIDPAPSDWLAGTGVRVNAPLPPDPAAAVIAVKPQDMATALPALHPLGRETVRISIAAGTSLACLETILGKAPIIRAMPNTPAAIGQGVSAIVGNGAVSARHTQIARTLMESVGSVVELDSEDQIDAVTGLSGP